MNISETQIKGGTLRQAQRKAERRIWTVIVTGKQIGRAHV